MKQNHRGKWKGKVEALQRGRKVDLEQEEEEISIMVNPLLSSSVHKTLDYRRIGFNFLSRWYFSDLVLSILILHINNINSAGCFGPQL